MASEAISVNTQKHRECTGPFARSLKPPEDVTQCQSLCGCSSKSHAKPDPPGANASLCFNGGHLGRSFETNCNGSSSFESGPSFSVENGTDNVVPRLRNVMNANGNNFMESRERMKEQKGTALEDLYLQNYDDEDDDDSDWEPVHQLVMKKWFCTNCTMPSFDDVCCCDICGEQKDSDVIDHELFKLPLEQDTHHSKGWDTAQKIQDPSSKICTFIGFDERMLLHSEVDMKSHPHPERPDRLRAIATSLSNAGCSSPFDPNLKGNDSLNVCRNIPWKMLFDSCSEITKDELLLVHSLDHVEAVQQTSNMLSSYFTSDTYANKHSARAARLAAGLCADLARLIVSGSSRNGFALVRPPGHHAGVRQAMGFCLHNNAAIAALAAQSAGAKKVLIVDWDVHHGNGTQEIFDGNKSVLYISLHRHEDGKFYPGTGAAHEVGTMDAEGFSVNIPWSCGGIGDNDYIFAFQHVVLPIAFEFDPDITIISAGFDAARGDPLGCCDVTPAGYAQMTHMLSALSQGKLLVILEGGYNLRSISSSATAVVEVLLGNCPSQVGNTFPSRAGLQTVVQVLQVQLKYWPILKQTYNALLSQWEAVCSSRSSNEKKKKRRFIGPIWWKLGSKRFVYEFMYNQLHQKRRAIRR